jgi:RHS repeat-associated protein
MVRPRLSNFLNTADARKVNLGRVIACGILLLGFSGASVAQAPGPLQTFFFPEYTQTGNFSAVWVAPASGGPASWFELERKAASTPSWSQVAPSLPTNGSYTYSSLLYQWSNLFDQSGGQSFGDLQYRLRACNNSGCGAWRSSGIELVPGPPSGAVAAPFDVEWPANAEGGSATITWTVDTHATYFRVERREGTGSSWTTVSNVSRPPLTVTFPSNGSWYLRVGSCNPTACSTFPGEGFTVVGPIVVSGLGVAVPSPPTVTASPTTSPTGTFTVSWNAPSGATRYEWQTGIILGSTINWSPTLNATTGTTGNVASLGTGSYRFRVRACASASAATCGSFGESNTVSSTLSAAAGETFFFHHYNAQGSVVATTDAAGNSRAVTYYRPFGAAIARSAGTSPTRLGFIGKLADADLGLVYFGARYYDPTYGRFVTVDPAAFSQDDLLSFNRYAYGNNNPLGFNDPNGENVLSVLDWFEFGRDVGGLIVTEMVWVGAAVLGNHAVMAEAENTMRAQRLDAAISTFGVINPAPGTKHAYKAARAAEEAGEQAGRRVSDLVPPVGSARLGEWGERRLSDHLGGAGRKPSESFGTSDGPRFIDRLVNRIAHESKAGKNVRLTSTVRRQILKDYELIKKGEIDGAHWHFWQGADQSTQDFLNLHRIPFTIH